MADNNINSTLSVSLKEEWNIENFVIDYNYYTFTPLHI